MDFSQQQYFGAAASQPYHFIGIPPLTPSHSNSAPSEEYNNQSPPEVFEQFPTSEQYSGFEPFAQFNQQAQAFPGHPSPPTPPSQHNLQGQNRNGGANGAGSVKSHQADLLPLTKADPDLAGRNINGGGGSNSDDDDMTPAQVRRKAQNRAAQRAFRERKERHVKDLEAKLASMEAAQQQAATENEKLKRNLQKMSTENEILRATSNMNHNGSLSPPSHEPTTTGPMLYNPTDFYSELLANHTNKTPSHRIVESEAGERLLAAGATWDFIIGHELFKRGLVDVGDVSERLKSQAKCDGQGPVFEERAIVRAINESVASGSDELL